MSFVLSSQGQGCRTGLGDKEMQQSSDFACHVFPCKPNTSKGGGGAKSMVDSLPYLVHPGACPLP